MLSQKIIGSQKISHDHKNVAGTQQISWDLKNRERFRQISWDLKSQVGSQEIMSKVHLKRITLDNIDLFFVKAVWAKKKTTFLIFFCVYLIVIEPYTSSNQINVMKICFSQTWYKCWGSLLCSPAGSGQALRLNNKRLLIQVKLE